MAGSKEATEMKVMPLLVAASTSGLGLALTLKMTMGMDVTASSA